MGWAYCKKKRSTFDSWNSKLDSKRPQKTKKSPKKRCIEHIIKYKGVHLQHDARCRHWWKEAEVHWIDHGWDDDDDIGIVKIHTNARCQRYLTADQSRPESVEKTVLFERDLYWTGIIFDCPVSVKLYMLRVYLFFVRKHGKLCQNILKLSDIWALLLQALKSLSLLYHAMTMLIVMLSTPYNMFVFLNSKHYQKQTILRAMEINWINWYMFVTIQTLHICMYKTKVKMWCEENLSFQIKVSWLNV